MRSKLAVLVILTTIIGPAPIAPAACLQLPPGARPGPAAGLYFVPGTHDSQIVDAFGMLYAYSPQDESGRMQIVPTNRRYQGAPAAAGRAAGIGTGGDGSGRWDACDPRQPR